MSSKPATKKPRGDPVGADEKDERGHNNGGEKRRKRESFRNIKGSQNAVAGGKKRKNGEEKDVIRLRRPRGSQKCKVHARGGLHAEKTSERSLGTRGGGGAKGSSMKNGE